MSNRDLAALALRISSLWITVEGLAFLPFILIGIGLFVWELFSSDSAADEFRSMLAGVLSAGALLIGAWWIRRRADRLVAIRDDDDSPLAPDRPIAELFAVVLTLYGLLTAYAGLREGIALWAGIEMTEQGYGQIWTNPGLQRRIALLLFDLVVGLGFMTAGRVFARLLLRLKPKAVVRQASADF